jgi:xanthine dehydrogenase molybdopterin-binding subunit B
LVHIYLDGTVLVSHGGVEMGQGLHTKMAMVRTVIILLEELCTFVQAASSKTYRAFNEMYPSVDTLVSRSYFSHI